MRGAVWILFLASDGSLSKRQKISDWSGGFEGLLLDKETFGSTLAGPGDVDGDGQVDLLVGSRSGVWTLLLNADGTVKSHQLTGRARVSTARSLVSSSGGSKSMVAVGANLGEAEGGAVIWFFRVGRDGKFVSR